MVRELLLVVALASPLAALDQGGQLSDLQAPQVPSPNDKDLCRYLKDVEAKTDAYCGQDALIALKSHDPATYSQKLELARKRKAMVLKAYEFLTAPPSLGGAGSRSAKPGNDPKPRHDQETASSVGKPEQSAPTQLQPPINERTFPAWLGAEEKDLKEVYARWLQAQSRELQQEKGSPVSLERRKEVDTALVANQAKITALGKIYVPEAFRCFLGEACGTRSELSDPSIGGAATTKGGWKKAGSERANAEVNGRNGSPAGRFGARPSEVPFVANDEVGTPSPQGPLPLLPITVPLGVGLIGYGVYRSRKGYVSEDGLNPEPKGEPTPSAVWTNRVITSGLAAVAIVGTGWAALTYLPPLLPTLGPATLQMAPALVGAGGGGAIAAEEAVVVGAAKAALLSGGAYAGARTLAQVKTGTDWPGYSFAKPKDDESSRLRGRESKRQHDRSGELRDKDFRRWFHRHWKKPGGPDASEEVLKEALEEWVLQGRPKP